MKFVKRFTGTKFIKTSTGTKFIKGGIGPQIGFPGSIPNFSR